MKVPVTRCLVEEKNAAIAEGDTARAARDAALIERETALAERAAALAERDTARAARDTALTERETALAGRAAALAERDTARAARDTALTERDTALAARDAAIAELDKVRAAEAESAATLASSGVSADDVIASIEMILGRTPDAELVEYHLRLGFPDRFALGKYMISTDEFRMSREWEDRAWRAFDRKDRLLSFGPNAWGLLVKTKHGLFAVDPEDGVVGAALLNEGCYSETEYMLAKSLISQTSDVLVVGAHIGAFAVPLSRACNELIAIEANPHTFAFLKTNFILNQRSNVALYNIAAGDKAAKIKFLKSPREQWWIQKNACYERERLHV
jgi:hypothetical protein